jgi:hypothetical protein
MPRQRKTSNTVAAAEVTTSDTSNTNNTNTTARRMKMALTAEQVRAIYAKRRTKGQYTELLTAFIESGDTGVSVKEEWTQLADKKAPTLKQGFENAKEKKDAPEGADTVDVITDGDDVFLINRAIVGAEELVEA